MEVLQNGFQGRIRSIAHHVHSIAILGNPEFANPLLKTVVDTHINGTAVGVWQTTQANDYKTVK